MSDAIDKAERARKLLERLRATPAKDLALVDRLRRLPAAKRREILARFTPVQLATLRWEWVKFWARPDQLAPPKPWTFWGCIGGRGSGKTRTCAERIRLRVKLGLAKRVHFIAATPEDAEEIMVNGPSGIRTISPPEERPEFFPSKGVGGTLVWPNGTRGFVFSAEKPSKLRGPQCSDLWCDDIAAWGPQAEATWKQAMWGFRLGDPECLISTTPMAIPLLINLIKGGRRGLIITQSTTDANEGNLASAFFENVINEFEGTALEEQERFGRLRVDVEGSMFRHAWIEPHRVLEPPHLERIVIAVDPPDAETERSDECGIVAIGIDEAGELYVLADYTGPHSSDEWAQLVVWAYLHHQADCVVVEANRSRGLIRRSLSFEAANLPLREVHAARGKATRAEFLALMYERGRVHHVRGGPGLTSRLHRRPREKAWRPETLEEEMCAWVPGKGRSPNGVDALVWGAANLVPEAGDWSAQEEQGPPDEAPPDPFRFSEALPEDFRYDSP